MPPLEVLEAAGSKWNFLPNRRQTFALSLSKGGHCIGVDPYYLTHKAQEIGYHPEVILAGRRINDSMTDSSSLVRIIQQVQPDEIYNLAAQSHVAVSFEEPEYTANLDAPAARTAEAARRLRGEPRNRTTRLAQRNHFSYSSS